MSTKNDQMYEQMIGSAANLIVDADVVGSDEYTRGVIDMILVVLDLDDSRRAYVEQEVRAACAQRWSEWTGTRA